MQQKRSRNPKSKLFQCTGYADCNMVFTRSEHLARHSRKHTGEKPFKCIVPECNKAFSRYDNMMQHTQTHRNHNYQVISNAAKEYYRKEKSRSTRTQTSKNNNKEIKETVPKELISSSGLYPSVSSSSSSSSSFSDEEELINTQISPVKKQKRDHWHQRRLSIA
ncbi:uncharacterized protein BX663DRAFT_498022, partial [Cokeromyces recurvatus]|uniref:uncharacterized protein n=1 Tax=Cokeromyces recurvatus TaxID=90255 RepID=UPI00221F6456